MSHRSQQAKTLLALPFAYFVFHFWQLQTTEMLHVPRPTKHSGNSQLAAITELTIAKIVILFDKVSTGNNHLRRIQ